MVDADRLDQCANATVSMIAIAKAGDPQYTFLIGNSRLGAASPE
jgi:hypothetical protein